MPRKKHSIVPLACAAAPLFAALASGAPALAQSLAPSSYDSMSRPIGFNHNLRQPLGPIDSTRADASGNRAFINGGVGGAQSDNVSAVAAGNMVNVVITGSNNTVVVNADQENSGDVSATAVLNGRVEIGR